MKLLYESGDVVKLEDTAQVGDFRDCRVILLYQQDNGLWRVRIHPDEQFNEEDSIGAVNQKWFIPNLGNLRR